MRYVTVPEPVTLFSVDGKRYQMRNADDPKQALIDIPPISMHGYLMRYVINEVAVTTDGGQPRQVPKMGAGYAGIKAVSRLDRLFAKAAPGDVVSVEEDDWKKVSNIIDAMDFNPPHMGMQLAAIADAWMTATDKRPEPKPVPVAPAPEPPAEFKGA